MQFLTASDITFLIPWLLLYQDIEAVIAWSGGANTFKDDPSENGDRNKDGSCLSPTSPLMNLYLFT